MNAMELHNVRKPNTEGKQIDKFVVDNVIAEVIWELAVKNPQWTFKTVDFQTSIRISIDDKDEIVCRGISFEICQNSAPLGYIGREYNSNKGYLIKVSNDRIGKNMVRGSAYRTDDSTKAIAKVNKMFKPMSTIEAIEKAEKEAGAIVHHERSAKVRLTNQYNNSIKDSAIDYVMHGAGYEAFIAWIATLEVSKSKEYNRNINMLANSQAELNTIEVIKNAMDGKKTALIVIDEGKYIVKIGADVQLYDDTTLPVDLRGKLGMLKLVNPKQFVTDMGCRVSDEIFVVKLDEPNIVS